MKQRLMLAHSLMRRPDVLVLDEPATGLDPAEVKALRQCLSAHAAAGAAVLISSHQLAEVQQLASHIVVMNKGRLVVAGPLEDLLRGAGSGTHRIRTEDAARAAAVLGATTGVAEAVLRGGDVVVTAPELSASELVAVLVRAGVPVSGADPARPSLEDAYLAVTEGHDHAAL